MRSLAQTYSRCVSGSYELGGQFAPPIVPGFIAIGSVQNGVKILPSLMTAAPLGITLEPSGGMSIDCGTIASPIGYGCVAAVACRGSCITAPLLDADQRLAGFAIENISPARLRHLHEAFAHAPVRPRRRTSTTGFGES